MSFKQHKFEWSTSPSSWVLSSFVEFLLLDDVKWLMNLDLKGDEIMASLFMVMMGGTGGKVDSEMFCWRVRSLLNFLEALMAERTLLNEIEPFSLFSLLAARLKIDQYFCKKML